MSFFEVKTDNVTETKASGYIGKSGFYDVTVLNVMLQVNKDGARSIDLYIDVNDQPQVLYRAFTLDKNNGEEHFERKLFNKFCILAGVENVGAPEEAMLPIGPSKAPKKVKLFTDLEDIDMKLRVQFEYSMYNNEIKEKKIVKAVYLQDGTTAVEKLNKSESGVQFGKDQKYADDVTYNGVTEEEVTAWITGGRGRTPVASDTTAKAPDFTDRKFGK